MAAPQQQQSDSSYDLVWIFLFVFAVGYGVWHFYHAQIVFFIFKLKLYQAQTLDFVMELFITSRFGHYQLDYDIVALENISPATVSLSLLYDLAKNVGTYARFPVMLILMGLGAYLYMKSVATKFKNKYSMNTLAAVEKVNWPQITPILGLNLVKQDITKGPWAMGLSPMEFAKQHKIIEVTIHESVGMRKKTPTVKLIKSLARQKFVQQLGPLWTGIDNVPPHARALFAIFSCRINRNRDDADKLIRQFAISSGTPTMNYDGVDEIIKKYIDSKLVKEVIKSHAYYLTVMSSTLLSARADGVVASADFLWLKPVDRRLWFLLNSIGRQTPYTEVAGPFGHWMAERVYGKKIVTPMVDTAIEALDEALADIVYVPDEDEE